MLKRLVLAVLAAGFSPESGQADWQYTQWGMTIDQAIGASNGALQPCTPGACDKPSAEDRLTQGAFGPYESGAFKFDAFLFFNRQGKLERVELVPTNRDKLPELFAALRAKYGEPTKRSSSLLGEASTWFTPSDQIILFEEESSSGLTPVGLTKLIYIARITAESEGL